MLLLFSSFRSDAADSQWQDDPRQLENIEHGATIWRYDEYKFSISHWTGTPFCPGTPPFGFDLHNSLHKPTRYVVAAGRERYDAALRQQAALRNRWRQEILAKRLHPTRAN